MEEKVAFKKRVWDFLGSRDFSVFVFVMALTYALILVIFGAIVPSSWVDRIGSLLPFKVLYILFFINLIICEIKWIPVVVRKCRMATIPSTPEDLERFRHKIEIRVQGVGGRGLEKYLRRRGYRIKQPIGDPPIPPFPHSPVLFYASKGRFSPIGNLLFHTGFLFLLAGAWFSLFRSFDGSAVILEEQEFNGTRGEYTAISTQRGSYPDIKFKIGKITPEYWGNQLLFTDLKADVTYSSNGRVEEGEARLSQPVSVNGARVTINGLGFVPLYVLKDRDGRELDSGYVRLNIFPPGAEDHFQIPGFPHQIFVVFYPDHEVRNGRVVNRSMNPVNPAYLIRVFRNRVLSYSGVLKPGQEAYYEGLRLSFPEYNYWGMFRIVRNSGWPFIWTGFILFIAGLVWKLLYYRKEIALIQEGDSLILYGNSDYYHTLFEEKLKILAIKK